MLGKELSFVRWPREEKLLENLSSYLDFEREGGESISLLFGEAGSSAFFAIQRGVTPC